LVVATRAGGFEAVVGLKPLKRSAADPFLAHEVEQLLALYKLLKAIGVPVEQTPMDAKVDREVLWPFVEAVVTEEGALSTGKTGLLVHVTVGIEIIRACVVGKVRYLRILRRECTLLLCREDGQDWRAACRRLSVRYVSVVYRQGR